MRWVAVRHADNHVHVVATLARQDGKRVWPRDDFYRSREASLAVEARYGLTRTSPADRTGDRQTSRAEQRRHARQVTERAAQGRPAPVGPDREVLRGKVRAALAGASGFAEFSDRLSLAGVLVRPRMSTLDPQEITGYAVALRASGGEGVEPVWFGGGKLAPDLTLPQLQARWCRQPAGPRPAVNAGSALRDGMQLAPEERAALWEAAGQAIGRAEEQLRAAASGEPAARAMAEVAARPDWLGCAVPPGGRWVARHAVRPAGRDSPALADPGPAEPDEPVPGGAPGAAGPGRPGRGRPTRRRAAQR